MKFPAPHPALVLLIILLLAAGLVAGCTESRQAIHTRVLKTGEDGTPAWSTPVNQAAFDDSTAIAAVPGGGYAVAGTVRKNAGDPAIPRIVRLGSDGKILWDRTLDTEDSYAVAIAPAGNGRFVAAVNRNNYDEGAIIGTDAGGAVLWNRSVAAAFTGIVPAGNGTFVLPGSRTLLVAENGTVLQDWPVATTAIVPTDGGGFLAARYGPPATGADILRLDGNGSVRWDRVLTLENTAAIGSLNGNPDGTIECVLTWYNPAKDRDTVMDIEAEKILLAGDGNITGRQSYPAAGPMTRTPDGGYTFLAYPFPGEGSYTTLPHGDSAVHLVHAGPDGTIAWDRLAWQGPGTSPQAIVPAADGGYVALVLTAS